MALINRHIHYLLLCSLIILAGCSDKKQVPPGLPAPQAFKPDSGFMLIAAGINYDVIVRPPAESDPWESERVSGYNGPVLIESIFEKVYSGTMTAYDIATGTPLSTQSVRSLERDMGTDRSQVSKLQFTEDWYYNASTGEIKKVVRSLALGYDYIDSQGRMFGYKALFMIVPGE
jgi:hypothetical protein